MTQSQINEDIKYLEVKIIFGVVEVEFQHHKNYKLVNSLP